MRINKEEALVLVKLLHAHDSRSFPNALAVDDGEDHRTDFQRTVEGLCERLDEFLVSDAATCDDDDSDEEDDDEEAEDDDGEEEEDSAEDDEESDEEDDTDEEGDSEDDESDESECEYECSAGELHDLEAVKTKKGAIEFEALDGGGCDLLLDGSTEHSVTLLRRKSHELHVLDDDGIWRVYPVSRFPKAWSAFFPLNELVEVIEE